MSFLQFKYNTFLFLDACLDLGVLPAFLGQDPSRSLICYQSFATSAFWILLIFLNQYLCTVAIESISSPRSFVEFLPLL